MRKRVLHSCILLLCFLFLNIGVVYAADTWVWPTPSIPISASSISTTWGGSNAYSSFHEGIDIPGPLNTPIVAAKDGTVCLVAHGDVSGVYYGAGNVVVINHGNGYYSHYAHLNSTAVSQGQSVSAGTIIGYMGSTGNSTGVHLHFAIATNATGEGGRINNNLGVINYVSNLKNTITFDTCGGSCSLSKVEVISNTSQYFAVNGNGYIPKKSGSRFLGWYDMAANPIYDAQGYAVPGKYWASTGSASNPKECKWIYSGNVTAYAWWGNTITFDAQGGTTSLSAKDVILNMPSYWSVGGVTTKAGATFCGWYDSNGNPIYDEKGVAVKGKYWALTGSTTNPKECKWVFTQDVTAYAKWKYTITFNAQGGTTSLSKVDVISNTSQYFAVNGNGYIPKKSGFSFLGWYDGNETPIYDAQGYAVPGKYWALTGSTTSPKECNWIYGGNVTAYAKWQDIHTHSYTHKIIKATVSAAGKEYDECSCGSKINETAIAKIGTVTLSETTYEYDGAAKQPSVTVKDANNATISSENYSVSYKNNVNPGTATATVTFKGTKYEGTVTRDFTISKTESEEKPDPDNNTTPETQPQTNSQIAVMDNAAKALSENADPAGSSFRILQVKGKKVKKTSITIAWKAVPKAAGYVVYGAPCGSRYAKLKSIKATSFTQSGLKKGKYYKYFVAAHDKNGKILASSKTVHIATSGGKKGNTKSVKLNKKKATLKKGKTVKLKAKLKNGKLKVSKHRKVAYESDNPRVATVSKNGKVKAVGKGKCTIYAYAQNGVFAKCKITVK